MERGLSHSLFPDTGSPSFLLGLPGWTSVGEDVPSAAGTRCPRVGWHTRWLPFCEGEGKGNDEGLVRVGPGGRGCDWEVK